MAKILAVSSQVVFGPVGLSAIVPALQAEGHEVLALPTVQLSNHPGHGKPAGVAHDLVSMVAALENIKALDNLDAVITGYFASTEQIHVAANLIRKHRPKIILIDPVLGDHGKLYVPESVAKAIRDELLPLATICMPNAFELSWLTGLSVTTIDEAKAAAQKLDAREVIVTSVTDGQNLATMRITKSNLTIIRNLKRDLVPNGTGDLLSGLYLARQFGAIKKSSLNDAMEILQTAIALSGSTKSLAIAQALHRKDQPHD